LNTRKKAIAKQIEDGLNKKNEADGKEKVEVDEDTVDWLYGTYQLKGDDTVYHRDENFDEQSDQDLEQMDADDAESQSGPETQSVTESQSTSSMPQSATPPVAPPAEPVEVIEVKTGGSLHEANCHEGILSNREEKPTKFLITALEEDKKDNDDEFEDLPDLEDIEDDLPSLTAKEDKPFKPMIEILDDDHGDIAEKSPSLITSVSPQRSTSKVLIEDITISLDEDQNSSTLQGEELTFTGIQDMTEDQEDLPTERPSNKESERFLESLAANVPLNIKPEMTLTATNLPPDEDMDEDEDRLIDSDLEDLD